MLASQNTLRLSQLGRPASQYAEEDSIDSVSTPASELQSHIQKLNDLIENGLTTRSKDIDESAVIKLLQDISLINLKSPNALFLKSSGSESDYYQILIKSAIKLFLFSFNPVKTQVGLFVKNVITATSTATLAGHSKKLHQLLLDICCAMLSFVRGESEPSDLDIKQYIDHSITHVVALEISFSIIQAFFRSATASPIFGLLFGDSYFYHFNSWLNSLWVSLNLLSEVPQLDVSDFHLMYADICRMALPLFSTSQIWVQTTSQWLFYMFELSSRRPLSADVDLTAASLALDLFHRVLKSSSIPLTIEERKIDAILALGNTEHTYLASCIHALVLFHKTNNTANKTEILKSLDFNNYLNAKVKILLRNFSFQPDRTLKSAFAASFIPETITDIEELKKFVHRSFNDMPVKQKRWFVRKLGFSVCTCEEGVTCKPCQKGISGNRRTRSSSPEYTEIFLKILDCDDIQTSEVLCHETINALKRVLTVFKLEIDLEAQQNVRNWLVDCFKNAHRPIRVAAALLSSYLISSEESFNSIFGLLSDINFSKSQYVSEAVILAWGSLGKIMEGERLNLILMCLIDFLSHDNAFLISSAFCQIQAIAKFRNVTCLELMTPFWPTISVSVVKRQETRPQLMSCFADLLSVTPEDFLAQTHRYTVPFMVLTKRKDVLLRISEALELQVERLLLSDISKTVAVLLIQGSSDLGEFVMQSLIDIHQPFSNVKLQQIVNTSRLEIACEVLKLHDPEDKEKSERITKVFEFLETLLYPKVKRKSSKMQPGEYFFDVNILGVAAPFAVTIRGTDNTIPFTEKIQCLNGIAKLISCSGNSFSKSVPQICTLLQAAMDSTELQLHVMLAWFEMVKVMGLTDLERVMDLTFSVIIQKWTDMTDDAKLQGHKLLQYLFAHKSNEMTRIVQTQGVPYLYGLLPELSDIYDNVVALQRPSFSPISQLKLLLKRGQDDNIYIVRQTVQEINEFLVKEHDSVKQALLSGTSRFVTNSLFRTLLNIPHKFQNTQSDIAYLCSQCLGFLGAIDSLKVDVSDHTPRFIVVHNFDDARECVKFVLNFVEHHLLKGFESSTKPYYQSFLAYGLQEYLKFCNFQLDTIHVSPQLEFWNKLSDQSKSILYPLLSSQYKISRSKPIPDVEYPIFSMDVPHSKWLQSFTMDLLGKVKGANATQIFRLCRKIIKDQDSSLFNFVIPYISLHVILSGTDIDRQNILNELLNVLSTDLGKEHDNSKRLEDLKKSYGIVFSIIDYCNQALRARQDHVANERKQLDRERVKKSSKNSFHVPVDEKDKNVEIVEEFMKQIPADLLAKRSFECKSYFRSLMYWEQHLTKFPASNDSQEVIYYSMMKIYASIDDPDSLNGIPANFNFRSVPSMVLQYESNGKWSEALECHDFLAKTSTWDLDVSYNRFRCIKDSGRYEDLLSGLETLDVTHVSVPNNLLCLGVEAAWLAGDFTKLQSWLNKVGTDHPVAEAFEVNVGRTLIALKENRLDDAILFIDRARKSISRLLEGAPVTSMKQCHEAMVRLHGLADLETIGKLETPRLGDNSLTEHRMISDALDERLESLGTNYDAVRYLLALRRSAINATQ